MLRQGPPPRAVRRRREPRRGSKARARVVPEKIQPPERPPRNEIMRHIVGARDDEENQGGNEGPAPAAFLHAHRLQRHAGEKAVLNEVPLLRRRLVPVYGEEQKNVHAHDGGENGERGRAIHGARGPRPRTEAHEDRAPRSHIPERHVRLQARQDPPQPQLRSDRKRREAHGREGDRAGGPDGAANDAWSRVHGADCRGPQSEPEIFRPSCEPRIERQVDRITDDDRPKVRVLRVEEVVRLACHNGAGNPEDHAPSRLEPLIADSYRDRGCRIFLQTGRQRIYVNVEEQSAIQAHGNEAVVRDKRRCAVDQHLENGERDAPGGVNDGNTGAIPAASVDPGAFSIERMRHIFLLDDAPGSDGQEKTPCSSRPINASPSLAPSSVPKRSRGFFSPRVFCFWRNQRRAAMTSPAKSSIAAPNTRETRRILSDSAGSSLPRFLRLSSVRGGIWTTYASS